MRLRVLVPLAAMAVFSGPICAQGIPQLPPIQSGASASVGLPPAKAGAPAPSAPAGAPAVAGAPNLPGRQLIPQIGASDLEGSAGLPWPSMDPRGLPPPRTAAEELRSGMRDALGVPWKGGQ